MPHCEVASDWKCCEEQQYKHKLHNTLVWQPATAANESEL